MPRFMRYFYRAALGKTLGPCFGRMGIMSAEINSYCRNITNNPILFGLFLEQNGARGASFMNVGGMLQNLRLAATSIGLRSYWQLNDGGIWLRVGARVFRFAGSKGTFRMGTM